MVPEPEDAYEITPKGCLVLDLSGAIGKLLQEQRKAFAEKLVTAAYLIQTSAFEGSVELADALAMIGYEGVVPREDRE